MKKMMWLFSILAFLFLGNVANAETDLFNLGTYNEGDTPSYGQDVIVVEDEATGVKSITQSKNATGFGRLVFAVQLSGDFEIVTRAQTGGESIFIISDEYQIEVKNLRFLKAGGEEADGPNSMSSSGVSDVKLSVINDVAKLYIDDLFISKIILKPDLVYTQLMMSRIDNRSNFYALNIDSSSVTTDSTTIDATQNCIPIESTPISHGDCMANYSLAGQLHVPCISVPDAFGGTTVYDIKMNQQTGSFTFDLDMGSVKPK